MQLGLAVAVALLVIAVVAWPLLTRRRNRPDASPTPPAAATSDNAAALNAVYDAIRTLQTDHGLGRVNDNDFAAQLDEYRRQAARILRDMDRETAEGQDA